MTEGYCTEATTDRFAARLLADTDCQALGMVERGYAALSQPGGTVSAALTGLMVIAVAFFGYRLLLGRALPLAEAMALTVKIGIVLVIATSWEAWSALAYQGLARAPTEIASTMLVGIGAPAPLESLERSLDNLTQASVGYRQRAGIASPLVGGPAAAGAVLNISAVLLTLSTVGVLIAAKVILAILLALAPAMIGLILFNATRGMAQGWLGMMAAAAMAPLFVLLVAAIEFAILTPIIARLLAEQAAGKFENAAVMPVGLVTIVFAIALVVAVRAGTHIARGIRLSGGRAAIAGGVTADGGRVSDPQRQLLLSAPQDTPQVSRALEVIARRETPTGSPRTASFQGPRASSAARDSAAPVGTAAGGPTVVPMLDRRSHRIRSAPRRSRLAARRDT